MKTAGFSLLEALLALALFAALGTGFLLVNSLSSRTYRFQSESSNLQQTMWIVSQLLQTDLPATGYRGPPDMGGNVAAWPAATRTIDFTAGSSTTTDLLIVRYRLDTADTYQGISYQLDATGGLNRVACQQTINPCTPGALSANTVVASPLEAFDIAFLTPSGWQSSLPAANNLVALGVYIRLRSNTAVGPNTCTAYPSLDADLPQTAASLGIISFTPAGQACRFLRQERFVVLSLPNPQVY